MSDTFLPPGVSPDLIREAAEEYRASRRDIPIIAPPVREKTADPIPLRRSPPGETAPSGASVALLRAADLTPTPINWLWQGYLAAGKFHILGGAPGVAKTTIAVDFAATVSSGGYWPDGSRPNVGNCVIWSGEDDPADTLVPRLIAAGADISRCFFVGDVMENGKPRGFDPARDIEPLRLAIRQAGGASLIVVDPIVSAVAGDSHKNAETRRALSPLVDLASGEGAALLGITHFSKGTQGREPTERITGSLAFGALARVVMIAAKAGEDDEEPKRVFMRAKSNIGADDGGFEYGLCQVEIDGHPGITASRVEWRAAIDGSARDVLGEAESFAERGPGEDARVFLSALLADGPVPVAEIKAHAVGSGQSWASVRRAKSALGVEARKIGFGDAGAWEWGLPGLRCSKVL